MLLGPLMARHCTGPAIGFLRQNACSFFSNQRKSETGQSFGYGGEVPGSS